MTEFAQVRCVSGGDLNPQHGHIQARDRVRPQVNAGYLVHFPVVVDAAHAGLRVSGRPCVGAVVAGRYPDVDPAMDLIKRLKP